MAIDITQDLESEHEPSSEELKSVTDLARRMRKLQVEIADLEATTKAKQAQLNELEMKTMPELMESVNIKGGLVLWDGSILNVKPYFYSTIPSETTIEKADEEDRDVLLDRRDRCLYWLSANGGDPLVKTEIKVKLTKSETEIYRALMDALTTLKVKVKNRWTPVELPIDKKDAIHPASLNKFLSEKMSDPALNQKEVIDLFAVVTGNKAEIKAPKKAKGEK